MNSGLKKNFPYIELYQIVAIIIILITSPYVIRVIGLISSGYINLRIDS